MSAISIRSQLRKLASRKTAEQNKRFFKTKPGEYGAGDQFLGITLPSLRRLVKSASTLSITDWRSCMRSRFHEERLFALLVLVRQYQSARSKQEQQKHFNRYLAHRQWVNNWDLVDSSAHHIVGAHLHQRSALLLKKLIRSKCLWDRRIAIVSTWYSIRRGEIQRTLQFSALLLNDKEDLMHKAVGWMLREAWKQQPHPTEQFLRKNYIKFPRTTLRYAIERMPKARRQAFLKGQI